MPILKFQLQKESKTNSGHQGITGDFFVQFVGLTLKVK